MRTINKNGTKFFVTKTTHFYNGSNFWDVVENNSWEPNTFRIFKAFLDKDHSYIDIGSWIGPTVLYGAHFAKHVYAIEPDPTAYKELEENVKLNPELMKKITLSDKCIADKCGKIKLGNTRKMGDSMSSILLSDTKNSCIVESITFDKFVKNNQINDCNFIKMDIEGGEAVLLPSMRKYLQKNKPTLHLSLHAPFFKNTRKDLKGIINALKGYKHIYYEDGGKVNLSSQLLQETFLKGFYSIVATDKK